MPSWIANLMFVLFLSMFNNDQQHHLLPFVQTLHYGLCVMFVLMRLLVNASSIPDPDTFSRSMPAIHYETEWLCVCK